MRGGVREGVSEPDEIPMKKLKITWSQIIRNVKKSIFHTFC